MAPWTEVLDSENINEIPKAHCEGAGVHEPQMGGLRSYSLEQRRLVEGQIGIDTGGLGLMERKGQALTGTLQRRKFLAETAVV